MKTCLYCIEEIHDKAVVCPQCRRDQGLFAGFLRSPSCIIALMFLVFLTIVYIDYRITFNRMMKDAQKTMESYSTEINKELDNALTY